MIAGCIGSYAGLCNSIGWTFCVDGLMSGVLPDGFTGVRRDAMVQWNEWWTAAHVETGRNDSVSKTPCGEKLFLICGSYQTSILIMLWVLRNILWFN